MFLKVSDIECLSTKNLHKVELNELNDAIAFIYQDRTEWVKVKCPLYPDTSSDHAAFVQRVYANCYLAIVMAELSARKNISATFDSIIVDTDYLLDNETFVTKFEEVKSDFGGAISRDDTIRILVSDLVNDLMDFFKLHYLEG